MNNTDDFTFKKCPGCEKILQLENKKFDLFKKISQEYYDTVINCQYCSGDCARKVIGEKDEVFRSKDE